MSDNAISSQGPLIDWIAYAQMYAEHSEIWQMRIDGSCTLLDSRRLTRVARERNIHFGGGPHEGVERLWLLGWLKADIVRTAADINEALLVETVGDGLVRVGTDEYGRRLYADGRIAGCGGGENRVGGAAGLKIPENIVPLFHPFRYHVLHWLEGMLNFNVSPLSTLTTSGIESLNKLNERIAGWKDERFSSDSFYTDLKEFNDRTSLAAAAEPIYYYCLFGNMVRQTAYEPDELNLSFEEYDNLTRNELRERAIHLFEKRVSEHKDAVYELFEDAGLKRVEEEHRRLCEATDILDSNRILRTYLRVSLSEERPFHLGNVGGAMLTLTMAEILRRAAEDIFDTELPEEDELGINMMSPKAREDSKKHSYGTTRLLDNKEAIRDFLKMRAGDFSPRIRWYVEGDTELGALIEAFEPQGNRYIKPINLRAQFGQKKKNIDASSFRERLRQDVEEGVFSYVSGDYPHLYLNAPCGNGQVAR